jgi:tRNA C32,U32 (ribose-2'-O)-methylase TrmJ
MKMNRRNQSRMNNTSRRIPRIQNAIAFVFGREDFRFEWKKILRCEEREREREKEPPAASICPSVVNVKNI